MVWIMDTISKLRGNLEPGVVTGKPIAYFGSKGRTRSNRTRRCHLHPRTPQGQEGEDPKGAKVIVQGFGNVGTYNALFLHNAGAKVVGISDITGGYYCADGIDIEAAKAWVEDPKHKKVLEGYTQPGLVRK
jgi:glutamate dehydrogenase/leucine dehydrogenase